VITSDFCSVLSGVIKSIGSSTVFPKKYIFLVFASAFVQRVFPVDFGTSFANIFQIALLFVFC